MKTMIAMILLMTSFANASVNQVRAGMSNRQANKIGITTGFGNPFPSILGMNLNYHVTDYLKASAGYGEISVSSMDEKAKVSTIGGGVDFMVPGWSLSPTAGLHVSKVDVSNSSNIDISVQGIEKSTTLTYAQAGVDWQAEGGFNIGVGGIAGLSGGSASGSYLSLGWFF